MFELWSAGCALASFDVVTCRGYTPMSDESLDPEHQTVPDTKEGLYIGWVFRLLEGGGGFPMVPCHTDCCWHVFAVHASSCASMLLGFDMFAFVKARKVGG